VDDGGILLIGCYTPHSGGGRGEGIVAAGRDPRSGALRPAGVVARTPSPSFLAWHPTLPVVYAANELPDGAVSAWRFVDGRVEAARRASTGGDSPCHVCVTPDGRYLLASNYGSGSIAVHALDDYGAILGRTDLLAHEGHGPDPARQASPHAHMVSAPPRWVGRTPGSGLGSAAAVGSGMAPGSGTGVDASPASGVNPGPGGTPDPGVEGGYGADALLAVDLGTDSIYPYAVAHDRLVPAAHRVHLRRGTGPRHLARHPDRRRVYVVGELDASVTVLAAGERGWHERHRVAAGARDGHYQPSAVAVAADGRFLYVANRDVDTIAAFALHGERAPELTAEVDTGGAWPRDFALIGGHLYVANERSHTVSIFVVDPDSGVPSPSADPVSFPSPTCLLATPPNAIASVRRFLAG
jgi:6-phosphogluconolactonase (cycloisomerase 2 family)